MNQFSKNAGSALFWSNRTKPALDTYASSHSYTPRCIINPTNPAQVFRYKKVDLNIQPKSNLKTDGGFLISQGSVPIAYESVEIGTGSDGSGFVGTAAITVASGFFQHLDKITIGGKSITIKTDGSALTQNSWPVSPNNLSSQLSTIASYLNSSSYGGASMPESGKVSFFHEVNSIAIRAKALNTNANTLAIGVQSSNNAITVSSGVASPVKAKVTIQNVTFSAFTGGAAGNNISIGYSTGAATSTPEVSINQGNVVDIKIQNGVTTAQQIVNAVTASSAVNAIITAALFGTSAVQAAPVTTETLDGGTSHIMNPWTRGDKVKNCFIASPKLMYGYSGTTAASFNTTETFIPINTILYQAYHATQIIAHPSFNSGAWFRKNTTKNSTVRLEGSSHNYTEVELKLDGTLGNTYTFEVRLNPNVGLFGTPYMAPVIKVENNGKRIVLTLGTNGGNPAVSRALTSIDEWYAAVAAEPAVANILKINVPHGSYFNISGTFPETPFSGGTSVIGSDAIKDGSLDVSWGSCRFTNFSGYFALGELGADGKSRIADDIGGVLKTSGKIGGFFGRVVPAGTPFKAYGYVGDIQFNAILGGLAGNNISINYTSGATAGAEVVTVSGSAITVQIANFVSTATQIRNAIAANVLASGLVSARVNGTANATQSTSMTPTPVSLSGGAAPLTTDSGYFIYLRRNYNRSDELLINQYGSSCYEVTFSKDLSNPNSFHHVCWLDITNRGDVNITGERVVFDILDQRANNQNATLFGYYSTTGTYNTYNQSLSMTPKNAHIIGVAARYELLATGTSGNLTHSLRVVTGPTEAVSIVGTVITVTIAPSSTIGTLQATIAANTQIAAIMRVVPETGYFTTSAVTTTILTEKLFAGGVDHWPYEGLWGFGYVNMAEKEFAYNNVNLSTTLLRKSPRAFENDVMIESFRLTKLS